MNCAEVKNVLHGYIDGEIDLVRSLEIERHLEGCPSCARAAREARAVRDAVSGAGLYIPTPEGFERRIRASVRKAVGRSDLRPLWKGIALATSFTIVIVCTWRMSAGTGSPSADESTSFAILQDHIRSLMPDHLTDVTSTDQHSVKPWFNGKVDFSPPVKDLAASGFPLVGGRLDVVGERPVAVLIYRARLHVINLFVWPSAEPREQQHSFSRRGYQLVTWRDGGMAYWAVSDLNPSELNEFVERVAE